MESASNTKAGLGFHYRPIIFSYENVICLRIIAKQYSSVNNIYFDVMNFRIY